MSSAAESNWALEPNFIIGSSLCSAMLDPALYQSFFTADLLEVTKALTCGNGTEPPISCTAVPPEYRTYGEVVLECIRRGGIPVGLHRIVVDASNPVLAGKRFMFTNPPQNVPVNITDVFYYIV